ncbi:hypothetical protein AB0I66_30725 [Streptomyces sp. NPDC050439]|uniref:hypothetical protein n=1 Tax=unclassified Streptomyces TaxID=2593676 RepID=UPI003449A606
MSEDEYAYEDDALMLALMGEPAPGAPGHDLEHAAAVADIALLREHIGVAGRALAAPAPVPEPDRSAAPVRPAGMRRRRVTMALGLAAAAAAVSLVGGAAWLAIESGGGINKSAGDSDAAKGAAPEAGDEDRAGGADQKTGSYVPCARLIVEGTVKRVEPVPGGVQDRIVLDVTRYYKPSRGAGQVTFVMDVNVDPRLRPGDRTLIGISKGEASPDIWSNKKADIARDRAWIERELRQEKDRGKGKEMTC